MIKNNKVFSLRAWARQLGMKSHGPLHAILNRQRKVPKKLVPTLIKSLKLDRKTGKYFEALVDFQRSKSVEEKEYYKDRLEALSPTPLREINDLEAYKYLTDPMHIILAELTQLKTFKNNPLWIRKHFRMNLNILEIEDIIKRLISLNVLEKKKNKLVKNVEHIYTKYEVKSEAIQAYHKFCSQMAIEQVSKQDLSEKEFNAIAFNIRTKDISKIKDRIREFVNNLVEQYEAPASEGDDTYQLNIQLFSLTQTK